MRKTEKVEASQDNLKNEITNLLNKEKQETKKNKGRSPGGLFDTLKKRSWEITIVDFFLAIASLVQEEKIECSFQWTKAGSMGGGTFKSGLEIEKLKI